MARQWTRQQYFKRVDEIEAKYEPLLLVWRNDACRMIQKDHVAMRNSSYSLRVEGFKAAFQIMRAQTSREGGVAILEQQLREESVPEYFKQPVQIILDDLQTDVVAPLVLAGLIN